MDKENKAKEKGKPMRTSSAYSAYSQNHASIESSEKLIAMLYEGILRFASQAKNAIEVKDIEKRTYYVNRTLAIFTELINSLEYSAGDVSYYLEGLYSYEIRLLSEANLNNDTKPLDEIINVTKELLEAWREATQVL